MSNPNFPDTFLKFELLPAKKQPGILGISADELRYLARKRRYRGDHPWYAQRDEELADALEALKDEEPSIHELERLRENDKMLRERIEYLESILIKHQIDPYKDDE